MRPKLAETKVNTIANNRLAELIQQSNTKAQLHQTYVLPDALYKMLVDEGVISQASQSFLKRRAGDASGMAGIPEDEIHVDSDILLLLRRLTGQIHKDAERLEKEFVKDTAATELPETLAVQLPKLMPIETSVQLLQSFLHAAQGDGKGRLIVGEKGVGKTTLAYYASHSYKESVDGSLLFLPVDYHLAPFLATELYITHLTNAFLEMTDRNECLTIDELRQNIQSLLDQTDGHWEELNGLSVETHHMLMDIIADDSLIVRSYCHFNNMEDQLIHMLDNYDERRDALIKKARSWINDVKANAKQLLCFCLLFELTRGRTKFETFSWQRLFATLIDFGEDNQEARQLVYDSLPRELQSKLQTDTLVADDIAAHYSYNEAGFAALGISVLKQLAEKHKIIIFMDNMDARLNSSMEARLLHHGMGFLQTINKSVDIDVLMCIRNSTYITEDVRRLDIEEKMRWESMQVRPPALLPLLCRRMEHIRASAGTVGATTWWFANFLSNWVNGRLSNALTDNIAELITARHPFNIRGQLDLFCDGAMSTVLHHERSKAIRASETTDWSNVTYEFCLRALLWGPRTFYTEDDQSFIPNIYDNRHPDSPFNALIRPLVINWTYQKEKFTHTELVRAFTQAGFPAREVDDAVTNARGFKLIREDYTVPGNWTITVWGRYFRSKIAYSLPYIQTVWWDVSMLDQYTVGPPQLLEWNELKTPTDQFLAWLHAEAQLVQQQLTPGDSDLGITPLLSEIQDNISKSLERIERSVHSVR